MCNWIEMSSFAFVLVGTGCTDGIARVVLDEVAFEVEVAAAKAA